MKGNASLLFGKFFRSNVIFLVVHSHWSWDIHEYVVIIAYLHIGEIWIGFTPKEHDYIVHRAK
jgi:hypothetical protein